MVLPLTADPNTSSLLDNKLKSEINAVRSAFTSASYKTKLVIILLGDGDISVDEVEDRIGNIRRSILLDQKSLCYIPHESTQDKVSENISSLLGSLYPQCIEYYRDLSKHARRKRNRSATPQPTIPPSTARVLPAQGWVVRYEFKLGVFAEFRQEMDAACRNFEAAYENLFTPEMIESIASWSPRFNQARLLADVIALRTIRCLLWTGQHTAAVTTWTEHREHVADLLNRRGKGTDNYGWEAWQSTWSKTMADLLTRAQIPGLNTQSASTGLPSIFITPDANIAIAERSLPREQLHHEGYWLKEAFEHAKMRRDLAAAIPEEDRQPPGQSPASKLSHTAQNYDTYLALEPYREAPMEGSPGFDHNAEIFACLDAAKEHFLKHGQSRMQEILQLQRATELIQSGLWSDAVEVLQPLWTSPTWRNAGWWRLLEHLGTILLDCAKKTSSTELILGITWELGSSLFSQNSGLEYSLDEAITSYKPDSPLSLVFTAQSTAKRLDTSFAFSVPSGHVGEPIDCQFVLNSRSLPGTTPIALSQVKIAFEGALKPVVLTSDGSVEPPKEGATSFELNLEDSKQLSGEGKRTSSTAVASASAQTGLSIGPGETKIFNFQVVPREAGQVSVASITALIEQELYNITVIDTEVDILESAWWETQDSLPLRRDIGVQRAVTSLQVLPKPPKVEIIAPNFKRSYYTNEEVQIDISVVNNEDEAVVPTVEARLISLVPEAAFVKWADNQADEETRVQETEQFVPARTLRRQTAAASYSLSLLLSETAAALDHELEINVSYYMESEPETILHKTLTLDIVIIRPFEANYDFNPRRQDEEWPNYFSTPEAGLSVPSGLTQKFLVAANLFSFAIEPVKIEAILLTTTSITGGAVASSTTGVLNELSSSVAGSEDKISCSIMPEETKVFNFDLTIQKLVLGDRETVALDLSLEIGWRRPDSDRVNTTILEVPRFACPMAEPRVLLTVDSKQKLPEQQDMNLVTLRYTVENPSMHFLTFNLGMEASEDFAFSGPKASAVSLVPISKYEVRYRILPNKRDTEGSRERKKERDKKGEWLKVHLNVVDAYFNQTLRVQPAGEGVRLDKKGGVILLID